MSEDVRARLLAIAGEDVCRTVISENFALAMSPLAGKDVFSHQPASRGAEDYLRLREELAEQNIL